MLRPYINFFSTYRTERCVRETIDSVPAQTPTDGELIVVDYGNCGAMARVENAACRRRFPIDRGHAR
jgi:hypothetical protein